MIEWTTIKRVLNGIASKKEQREVEMWRKEDSSHERFFKHAASFYASGNHVEEPDSNDVNRAWERFEKKNRLRSFTVRKIARVITLAAMLSGFVWWLGTVLKEDVESTISQDEKYADVMLVLSDGSVHSLNNADETLVDTYVKQLHTKETGTSDTGKEEKLNELIVPSRKTYSFVLPDGSKVMVNTQSRVRFPDEFNGEIRRVYLEGEAFFDVVHNKKQPFVVSVNGTNIKVLGTSFNVRAYQDVEVSTSLVAGKIALTHDGKYVELNPGEECVVNTETETLDVRKADLSSILAWMNGEFQFKGERLEVILEQLAQWYDVKIEYASEELKDRTFYVYMSRNKELDEVLKHISMTGQINYEIKDRTVYIYE